MHFADYKTILSPQNNMNIYRGCTHGCIYCDSRSHCYQMQHPFEDIEVKRNAPAILAAQLRKRRTPCMIATGAMCDPYIPLEEELRYTRQCLEVIAEHGFGLSILTKSARILRDMDVLQTIHRQAKCVVQLTLTTHDEALCRQLEPHVSTTRERVDVLHKMREAGIPTVVWLSPTLPFINDTEDNLASLLDSCVQAGVHGILCFGFGMTLREGNREYYYAALNKLFPGLKQRYIQTFGNRYGCSSPHHESLMALFSATCRQHGLLYQPQEVLDYLKAFPPNSRQVSMFDESAP